MPSDSNTIRLSNCVGNIVHKLASFNDGTQPSSSASVHVFCSELAVDGDEVVPGRIFETGTRELVCDLFFGRRKGGGETEHKAMPQGESKTGSFFRAAKTHTSRHTGARGLTQTKRKTISLAAPLRFLELRATRLSPRRQLPRSQHLMRRQRLSGALKTSSRTRGKSTQVLTGSLKTFGKSK